eukprot:g27227.t1
MFKVIRQHQHGFVKRESCITNLLEFFAEVTCAVDKGEPMDVLYLDFQKAFDKVPHQRLKGVAVGTCMGPSYVCLCVGYVEQSLFHCYTGTTPHLFFRYVDGCIGTASCSREELEQFINFTNTFHPNLQFTWTISDTSLSFLDLSISIS